jgi:hypothetical protein
MATATHTYSNLQLMTLIKGAKTINQLYSIAKYIPNDQTKLQDAYEKRLNELTDDDVGLVDSFKKFFVGKKKEREPTMKHNILNFEYDKLNKTEDIDVDEDMDLSELEQELEQEEQEEPEEPEEQEEPEEPEEQEKRNLPSVCKYGQRCRGWKSHTCPWSHPQSCRFGKRCKKQSCLFFH